MKIQTSSIIAFIKKHPLGIGSGLVTLVIAVGLFLRMGAVPANSAILEEKTAESERLKANIANSAQLAEQLEAIKAANQFVSERLVPPSELAKNLQYFYRLEADTGTNYTDLRQLPLAGNTKGPKPNFISVPYNITVEGEYPQLLSFLRRLENGTHYCRILGATLNRTGIDVAGGRLVMTLKIELLGQP